MKLRIYGIGLLFVIFQLACRPSGSTPQLSTLADDKPVVPKDTEDEPKPSTVSNEKLKSATEAAIRRDIQLKKEEMSRKRQDLERATGQAETAKDRVARLESDIASTVPERVPINTSSDAAIFGSVVDQRRANQAAEEKKIQLRAEADKQRSDLQLLQTKIAEIEKEVDSLELEIEALNQELTDIATGKKVIKRS